MFWAQVNYDQHPFSLWSTVNRVETVQLLAGDNEKKRGKGVLGVSEREGKAGVGDESKDVYM